MVEIFHSSTLTGRLLVGDVVRRSVGLDILPGSSTLRYQEKLRVATLHGRLPTSPGPFSSQQALTLVRYGTKPFLHTSEYLGKLQTLHKLLSEHSHPFLTLAKRIGLEPKHIP